jgi:hypothetical protein
MKVELLKRLRRIGRNKVTVYSVTKTNGITTGMIIGFNESCYRGLFELGDTEKDIKEKAAGIYIENYIKNHNKP